MFSHPLSRGLNSLLSWRSETRYFCFLAGRGVHFDVSNPNPRSALLLPLPLEDGSGQDLYGTTTRSRRARYSFRSHCCATGCKLGESTTSRTTSTTRIFCTQTRLNTGLLRHPRPVDDPRSSPAAGALPPVPLRPPSSALLLVFLPPNSLPAPDRQASPPGLPGVPPSFGWRTRLPLDCPLPVRCGRTAEGAALLARICDLLYA